MMTSGIVFSKVLKLLGRKICYKSKLLLSLLLSKTQEIIIFELKRTRQSVTLNQKWHVGGNSFTSIKSNTIIFTLCCTHMHLITNLVPVFTFTNPIIFISHINLLNFAFCNTCIDLIEITEKKLISCQKEMPINAMWKIKYRIVYIFTEKF